MMRSYQSRSGKASGVVAYEIGMDFIKVKFANDDIYKYSYASAGKRAIEEMKRLALNSEGLSTFISQNHPPYEEKWTN
jgi:hypothetical protein